MNLIPSHSIAVWLLSHIDRLLNAIGLGNSPHAEQIVYFIIIVAFSILVGWLVQWAVLHITRKLVKLRHTDFGEDLLHRRTLTSCSHVIPPLVFLGLVPFAFSSDSGLLHIIIRVAVVYSMVTLGIAINAVLVFAYSRYNQKANTRNLPLKGALNIARGIVWGIVAIISVSVLIDKSPAALLGGLTAFAAVLMLIFKDSILGFVAGIQMAQNDMLRVGDWIEVPGTKANGVVEDVSLTVVKVRNFDNTLIMVPPYTLVSTSFQNWRGMSQSGMRRISQDIYFDPRSIKLLTAADVDALVARFPSLKDFVDGLRAENADVSHTGGTAPVNGTLQTNLGLFRAYFGTYLTENSLINHSDTANMMITIKEPTPQGIPVNIYCFAATTNWTAYEAILSAVIERAFADAPAFGLALYSQRDINVTQTPAATN